MLSLIISLALAQHWEASGVRGGTADAACKAVYGMDSTLEFVPPARKPESEDPDNVFRECWYRTKGESTADGGNAPVKMTVAYFIPAPNDDPDEKKADAGTSTTAKQSRCNARRTSASSPPSRSRSSRSTRERWSPTPARARAW